MEQRGAFLDAVGGGRLHHAWLLAGPKGIGKRRFADWAALKLVSGEGGTGDVDPEHPAARLVAAAAHPDHRVLTPPEEGKGSASASILIDHIRELGDFLHNTPAMGGARVLVVDAIDNMNPNTSNAFLKELEEPRAQTVFLLVTHAPGRLLPTIRSRCRTLRFMPLSEAETCTVLRQESPGMEAPQLAALATLAGGAPGAALGLAGADILGLDAAVDRVAAGEGAPAFARTFQPVSAVPRLQALCLLVPRRIAAAARRHPVPELMALYDEADTLARDAVPLAYERVQVAMALADILARAGRIERQARAQ